MLKCGKTKIAKEEFHGVKKSIKIWDLGVDNIAISKLIETKNSSKDFIGYLDEVMRSLVLILPKVS